MEAVARRVPLMFVIATCLALLSIDARAQNPAGQPSSDDLVADYWFLNCLGGHGYEFTKLGFLATAEPTYIWKDRNRITREDPFHAHNPDTGQNFAFDTRTKSWIDAKTGAAVCPLSGSRIPAPDDLYADYWFLNCLGGHGYEFTKLGFLVTGELTFVWKDRNDITRPEPFRAHDPKTGRNFVWDSDLKAWIDAKSGASVCPAQPANTGPPPPIEVTKLTDDGSTGTLRWAIQQAIAAGGGSIVFTPGLNGTIVLQSNLPTITEHVVIAGPGDNMITISGNGRFSGFTTASPRGVLIYGLTITNAIRGGINVSSGSASIHTVLLTNSSGSGIHVFPGASFHQIDSTISLNTNTTGGGGGLAVEKGADVFVAGSAFTGNTATTMGGGILNDGTLTLVDSVITNNAANGGSGPGGGLWVRAPGTVSLVNNYFRGNRASLGAGVGIVAGGSANLYFNTFFSNTAGSNGGTVYQDGPGSGVFLRGNLFNANTGGETAGTTGLANNMVLPGNPPFASLTGGRLAPLPGNPALGGCPTVPGVFTDAFGNDRPRTDQPDSCGAVNPNFTFALLNPPGNVAPATPFTLNTQLFWLNGQTFAPGKYPGTAPIGETIIGTPLNPPGSSGQSADDDAMRAQPAALAASAQLGPYTASVDAEGRASVPTQFTQPGAYSFTITGPTGFTPTLYSMTSAGPPSVLRLSTGSNSLSAAINTDFAPLQVLMTDAAGNPVAGVTVTFTAPSNGASGAFTGSKSNTVTTLTDPSGLASALLTANAIAGNYQVAASGAGLPGSVSFNLTNFLAPSLRSGNPVLDAVTNRAQIVPGSWVTVYGSNLSGVTKDWSDQDFSKGLPASVAGVQVLVNGVPAPVWYVSPGQVNFQAPGNISGSARIAVSRSGVATDETVVSVVSRSPGVISYSADFVTYYPAAQFSGTSTVVGDPAIFGDAVRKAKPGDQITAYVTGLAGTQSGIVIGSPIPFTSPVTIKIGSTTVTPSFIAQIGPGYYQVNFTIPAGTPPGNVPFSIAVDQATSQANVMLVVGP